jgi:hypothetical protein
MLAPIEAFTRIAQRSQEAVTAALQSFTATLTNYADTFSSDNPLPLPSDTRAAVDTYFELARKLLAEQRALAGALVRAGTQAVDTLTDQARTVASVEPLRPADPIEQASDAPAEAVALARRSPHAPGSATTG